MVWVVVSLSVYLCVYTYVDIASGAHRLEIILLFSNLVENIILSFFDLARVTTFIYNIHSSLSILVILSYFRFSSSLIPSSWPRNSNIICVYGDYYNNILYDCNIIHYDT
jgi:hypothetical protein